MFDRGEVPKAAGNRALDRLRTTVPLPRKHDGGQEVLGVDECVRCRCVSLVAFRKRLTATMSQSPARPTLSMRSPLARLAYFLLETAPESKNIAALYRGVLLASPNR